MSRAYTREEMQQLFIAHLKAVARYWATPKDCTIEERLEGVEGALFSFLVTLDGGSGGMPAFDVVPRPHSSDEEFHRSMEEDFWPCPDDADSKVLARLGIHGGSMLHELLHAQPDLERDRTAITDTRQKAPAEDPPAKLERSIPKYPSIVLTSRRPEIFDVKEVIATEKLHGSNFRLHFPCGMTSLDDIQYGSHDTILGQTEKFPLNNMVMQFKNCPEQLVSIWEVVKAYGFSDVTIFGEAFGPGINAKGVKYSTGQHPLFRAFDIMVGENFLTYDLFCEVSDKMGLFRVPEVWRGPPTQEAFDALLDRVSTIGKLHGIDDPNNIAEGVVIRSNPLLRNVFGEWLIAKHKNKRFSEVAHAPSLPKVREASPVDAFAATYVTEGRVTNAVGRLQDRGVTLKNTMADMPTLLTEIIADLHKECEPEWLALNAQEKQLTGAVSKVLSPIYRGFISEGARS